VVPTGEHDTPITDLSDGLHCCAAVDDVERPQEIDDPQGCRRGSSQMTTCGRMEHFVGER
jgi:hypothetical protein